MTGQRRSRPIAGLLATLAVIGVLAGCGAAGSANGGPGTAPVPSGQNTAPPDLAGVSLPNFVMPQIKGAVARPNSRLTPGSVVNSNTNSVCAMSAHHSPAMTVQAMQQVYTEYGDTTPAAQNKLKLNYLVPLYLGGGTGVDNIWPVALRGTGFFQKVQTDHVLRILVCHRTLSLAAAQHAEESNWYAAWLRYVVATGNA